MRGRWRVEGGEKEGKGARVLCGGGMGVRVGRRMVGMRGDGAGGWCEVGGILAAGTDGTGLLLEGW